MDEPLRGSYLRTVNFQRPSRLVTLATVATGALLAIAGFVVGKGSEAVAPPTSVQLRPAPQLTGGNPIVVPSSVEMPRR